MSAAVMAGIGTALAAGPAVRAIARRLDLDERFLRAESQLLRSPAGWRAFAVEQRALFTDLPELEERLSQIDAPTTIVSGTSDRIVTPRAAGLLAAQIPGAQLELITGAGHLLPHTHGAELAAIVGRVALTDAGDPKAARPARGVDGDGGALGLVDQRLRDRRG
jgi:pimeloyl-ACP methyl ester carboxylesterase